jgi:cell division inhibitor SepF
MVVSGALRKTMIYLGLAEDDDRYTAYDDFEEDEYVPAPEEEQQREREEERRAPVTPIGRGQVARVVSSGPERHRITTIHPRTYNEAKTIGENFRAGTPVIMNLTDMDDNDAKRLVDFAAGLIFGLHGSIERVTSKVFLLSPAHVDVATPGKPRPTEERGFFNQS